MPGWNMTPSKLQLTVEVAPRPEVIERRGKLNETELWIKQEIVLVEM